MMKNLFVYFTAGCIGGLLSSLVMWQFGQQGITSAAGVAIMPYLSAAWLYPRLVWGGIYGLLFILPFLQSRLFLKAALLSLVPTAVQLLFIFPSKGYGMAGLELGMLAPAFVVFFNWVWGFSCALAIKLVK